MEQLSVDKDKAVMKIMMLPEVELEIQANRLCAISALQLSLPLVLGCRALLCALLLQRHGLAERNQTLIPFQ
jgi:hypothetical protein